MTDYPNNIPAKLEIIKASEITPKEVRWLWYPYIPFGKVTLLQGDPGDGKSKLMLSLAALLSKGAPLPFADEDESGEPMTVIYQTTEDDADDTVVPRFNSAGGDGNRLIFIKEDEKSLTFGDDRIREAVEKYNAKLLILDPMSSYIGDTCSMNNANETRAEFNHLIAVSKDDYQQLTALAKEGITSRSEIQDLKSSVSYYRRQYFNASSAVERLQERYDRLKEKCQPFLQALEHFPKLVEAFVEKVKELFSIKEAQERMEREDRAADRKEQSKHRRGRNDWER